MISKYSITIPTLLYPTLEPDPPYPNPLPTSSLAMPPTNLGNQPLNKVKRPMLEPYSQSKRLKQLSHTLDGPQSNMISTPVALSAVNSQLSHMQISHPLPPLLPSNPLPPFQWKTTVRPKFPPRKLYLSEGGSSISTGVHDNLHLNVF